MSSAQDAIDRLIVDQSADALVYAGVNGMIERWNKAATNLFGFTDQEALGQSLDLIIPEHLRAAHWAAFDRAVTSRSTRLGGAPTLTRALHKSGQRLYVEMSFALILDAQGAVLGSVAIARDATERVEKERARSRPSA